MHLSFRAKITLLTAFLVILTSTCLGVVVFEKAKLVLVQEELDKLEYKTRLDGNRIRSTMIAMIFIYVLANILFSSQLKPAPSRKNLSTPQMKSNGLRASFWLMTSNKFY